MCLGRAVCKFVCLFGAHFAGFVLRAADTRTRAIAGTEPGTGPAPHPAPVLDRKHVAIEKSG